MTTDYVYRQELEHVMAALMPQNRLIVDVMLHTGMRIGDVLQLRTEQLKPSGWYVEQKTGKRRRFGLPKELLAAVRAQSGSVWAFEGRGGMDTHKTRQAVWCDLKRAQRAFRMPQNIGTHSARKIYAVDLMRKYGSMERVRKALNHSSPAVTAIYAMADILTERRHKK